MNTTLSYQPHIVREDFVDFMLEKANPLWTWKKVKAKVQAVQALSADMFQVTLEPNKKFNGKKFRAGQSVLVTVVIEGVRHQRSYSIVRIEANGAIVLGIRVQGLVSRAVTQLRAGTVIELSQAQGEFCLHTGTAPAILLASGSGITAIYSLLQQAIAQNLSRIDVLYFSRDNAYDAEIAALAAQHSNVHYRHINTSQQKQHLTVELLTELNAAFDQTATYACGAAPMMRAVQAIYRDANSTQLHSEFFQPMVDETLTTQPVVFLRSQQQFDANSNLLESAEQAGLRPAHGCRMGICNTCSCTKVSGSTKNILTGEIDHANNTQIKLCISQAISPVTINL